MPLKQCNHSASLLVYQRDGHKCRGGEKKKDRERERESSFSPRPCRYLKSYTVCKNLQRWGTRSVSLEGMSFERIVSQWQSREGNPANAEASQTLILFLLLPYHEETAHYDRVRESASQQKHTHHNKQGHAVNEPLLQLPENIRSRLKNFMDPIHDPGGGFRDWTCIMWLELFFLRPCPLFLLITGTE